MECTHIPVINYNDFDSRLYHRSDNSRIPISGSLEVTVRCNLRCAHCYINLPAGDRRTMERELTCREFCNILDQIVDEGCLWLLLTGGEPFIRSDFIDIYTHAKKKGFLITLFSNGTTITPRIADYLADWRPFSLEISLYGSTQETYERITGITGSHSRCMHGIELLLEHNIPLKLKSPVMTLNMHEVCEMKSCAEKLGVDFRFDPILNMRMDGDPKPAQFRVTPGEVVALDLADEKRMKDWAKFCEKFWGPPPKPEYIYQCGAGVDTFHIDPYGRLSACLMARVPGFDLRQEGFKKGWNDFIPGILAQKWSQETPCRNCELYSLCNQCPAYAQIECGDQESPVEYLCQIAKIRAEAFGLLK